MKRILIWSFCCWLLVVAGCRTTTPTNSPATPFVKIGHPTSLPPAATVLISPPSPPSPAIATLLTVPTLRPTPTATTNALPEPASPPIAAAAPSPTHPAVASTSPDFSNIVFISGNQLYALDVNTLQVTLLLDGSTLLAKDEISGYIFDPKLSPDRQQIALTVAGSIDGGIYLVNADGSDPKLLHHHRRGHDDDLPTGLAWSLDSQKIAFERNGSIYVVGANISRAIEDPWRDGGAMQTAPDAQFIRLSVNGSDPDWSPDGEQLVFSSNDGKNIHSIALQSGTETQLTHNVANERSPLWSPDGQQIVFISDRKGQHDIYLIDGDGSNERQLTDTPDRGRTLTWSPDGQQLLYRSENSIFVIHTDGSGQKLLVSGIDGSYVPSPDGQQIIFVDDKTMYMMNSDGSNPTKLLTWPQGFGSIDW